MIAPQSAPPDEEPEEEPPDDEPEEEPPEDPPDDPPPEDPPPEDAPPEDPPPEDPPEDAPPEDDPASGPPVELLQATVLTAATKIVAGTRARTSRVKLVMRRLFAGAMPPRSGRKIASCGLFLEEGP